MPEAPRSFLFVCTGNICRSPTAEGVMQHQLQQRGLDTRFHLDSAGVASHHIGQPPDPRTVEEARAHGVDLTNLRARNVTQADFSTFDVILAMDHSHLQALKAMSPPDATARIALYLDYAGITHTHEVPDPYYGTKPDFTRVFMLVNEATTAIISKIIPENS